MAFFWQAKHAWPSLPPGKPPPLNCIVPPLLYTGKIQRSTHPWGVGGKQKYSAEIVREQGGQLGRGGGEGKRLTAEPGSPSLQAGSVEGPPVEWTFPSCSCRPASSARLGGRDPTPMRHYGARERGRPGCHSHLILVYRLHQLAPRVEVGASPEAGAPALQQTAGPLRHGRRPPRPARPSPSEHEL